MASDFFLFDGSLDRHLSSDMLSSTDGGGQQLFFSDPFLLFDSSIDVFQSSTENQNHQNPFDESPSLDQISSSFLSSSPPSNQLENLSLYQATQLHHPVSSDPNLEAELENFSGSTGFEVKSEESQMGFDPVFNKPFFPHSYSGVENVTKLIQRSLSSNSFEGKPGFVFQPLLNTLMDPLGFQNQPSSSPENSFLAGQMRRVCSTGDLQKTKANPTTHRPFSSPLSAEKSFLEETNFKVGRYSAEERKERISKYRAKKTQRNFNKTIKYACRKTLADNRPRVRGRFARNDESGEIPKAPSSTRDDDEYELWFEGSHEEQEELILGRGEQYVSTFGANQFQYYGFG